MARSRRCGTWGADSPSQLLRRGQWNKPGIRIEPGFLEVLSPGRAEAARRPREARPGTSGRRLALARWMTRPDHPLTARVIVNRAWHHHLGAGIVATPGNLGRNGAKPTHPELLDWLATDFVDHGWSLKHLHRRIMLSATYRQASHRSDRMAVEAVVIDPGNRLLWRTNLRRIESEVAPRLGAPGLGPVGPGTGWSSGDADDSHERVVDGEAGVVSDG